MPESTQHKLDRNRPPRVQITYDVHIGDAVEKKEIPFVVGIMSDLAGKPVEPLPRVKDRKFIEIDRDNFDGVLGSIKPRMTTRVDDRLSGQEDSKLNVELTFNRLEDFEPYNIVQQVEPLRQLFEARQRLMDLVAKLDGNDALDELLQNIVDNSDSLKQIKDLTGGTDG